MVNFYGVKYIYRKDIGTRGWPPVGHVYAFCQCNGSQVDTRVEVICLGTGYYILQGTILFVCVRLVV